ncbi:MAG: glycosyltransferase [Clostridia bacterium]|nr:glycosyltransferase [Clostridia bacterium]
MARNVLILVDKYMPSPSSNGACAYNIVAELKQNGYAVKLLSIYDSADEDLICLDLVRRPASAFNRLFGYCEDSEMVDRLYRRAAELHEKYNFDFCIAFFRPVETLLCAYRLFRKYRLPFYPVFFDVIDIKSVHRIKNYIFKSNFIRLVKKFERRGVRSFCLKYYAPYFECFGLFPEKIGIPNIMPKIACNSKSEYTELVYAGSFYADIRNPEKVLSFLRCIRGTGQRLHLYSWGCEDVIDRYKNDFGDNLVLHGRQDITVAHEALAKADVLVNISNDDDKAVPGKIIEYFSYGKPIVNFYFRKDDPAMEEYQKYPTILNVYVPEIDRYTEDDLAEFLKKAQQTAVSGEEIAALYADCTPGYFLRKVFEDINGRTAR